MKHKTLFAGLCVLAVLLMCFVAYADDQGVEKLCENVYFQPSGVNNHGTIHLRGKLLGYTLARELARAVYEIEGVASVTPYPYSLSIAKGEMYSWEEIFKDMAQIVQNVMDEAGKRAKDDKTGI